MARTHSTGWLAVSSGQTTMVSVDVAHLVSSRMRWRGKDRIYSDWDVVTEVGFSAVFPDAPPGWDVSDGVATYRITVITGAHAAGGTITVSAPGGSSTVPWTCPANSQQDLSVSCWCWGIGTAHGTEHIDYGPTTGFGYPSVTARAYYVRSEPSQMLSATVNGVAVPGPASLTHGEVTGWYGIALQPGANSVVHSIQSSGLADIEIEYEYQPYAPPPTIETPEFGGVLALAGLVFELSLPKHDDSDAVVHNVRLQVSALPSMAAAMEYDSTVTPEGWEWLEAGSWHPWPAEGVLPGTRVRCTLEQELAPGLWYWQATTHDDWAWGAPTSIVPVRVVLSPDSLSGYALAIGETRWSLLSLLITESANGEVGTIEFGIRNWRDSTGNIARDKISYNDLVYLTVYDETGAETPYLGRVWRMDPDDMVLRVTATMGDKVLSDRYCTSDYEATDVGEIMRDILATDCPPLVPDGVPNFGVDATIKSRARRPLDVFQEIHRTLGIAFWCRTDAIEWIMHAADPRDTPIGGVVVVFPSSEEG